MQFHICDQQNMFHLCSRKNPNFIPQIIRYYDVISNLVISVQTKNENDKNNVHRHRRGWAPEYAEAAYLNRHPLMFVNS